MSENQGRLFDADLDPVRPAATDPGLQSLALGLPDRLRLGTSSWAYPGWKGSVYHPQAVNARLAREGLRAYARHPLLRCAGIDQTYYKNLSAEDYRRYAKQTPNDFRFVIKAHAATVLETFPRNPRFGALAGQRNRNQLDPIYATNTIIKPILEGLGHRAGVLLFQMSPGSLTPNQHPGELAGRIYRFLDKLPDFPGTYAFELRDPAGIEGAIAEALASAGAAPCLNVTPGVPSLRAQAQAALRPTTPALIIRWMVRPGMSFTEAEEDFKPYDRLKAEDPRTRKHLAELCLAPAQRRRPSYVLASNKAEGSSPLSLFRLAAEIDRQGRGLTESARESPKTQQGPPGPRE